MKHIASAKRLASYAILMLFSSLSLFANTVDTARDTKSGWGSPDVETVDGREETTLAAVLRIENMTKLPGTNRSFPEEDFFTFHRINDTYSGGIKVHDKNVARIHNDGNTNLIISAITTTNPALFTISNVTIPQTGLIVKPGSFRDVTITFINNSGPVKQVLTESLIVVSNVTTALEPVATLRGAYMRRVEGSNEIDAQQVFDSFGFQTEMGRDGNGNFIVRPGSEFPSAAEVDNGSHGDLIFPNRFIQADPSKNVQIIQLSAFHSPGGAGISFRDARNNLVGDMRYFHASAHYQTLLPKARENVALIAGDVTPGITVPFSVSIAGYSSIGGSAVDPFNYDLLGTRIYRVIDRDGNTVPNEYILLQDYVGKGCAAGSSNCDWNDNVSYIINVRPEFDPTATPIDDVVVNVQDSERYDVSGSFDKGYAGNRLFYSATLSSGSPLPNWVVIDEDTGIITFSAPASATGQMLNIRVTATDYNEVEVSSTFKVTMRSDGFNCTLDANADGLPKVLDCTTFTATLSGQAATGIYNWTGPNNFTSTEQNPVVRVAGRYSLSTSSGTTPNACDAVSIVTVTLDPACTPVGRTSFALEAECATVGSGWDIVSDPDASNGSYAVRTGSRSVSVPPATPAGHVSFTVDGVEDGRYYMYARVRATNAQSNSFWFRVNGGGWFEWYQDIIVGDDFNWNSVLGITFNLNEGTNVIEFAYREDGAALDKIFLSQDQELPVDLGPIAVNCGNLGTAAFSLEAECAEVGSGWSTIGDSDASNGSYVVWNGKRALSAAPSLPSGHVKFTVEGAEAGVYNMYARVRAISEKDDSFWVRINNGAWINWSRDIMIGDDFNWNTVLGSPFTLTEGTNTIEFGYRENGTQLDKIYLSKIDGVPVDFGPVAENCDGDGPPIAAFYSLEAECGVVGSDWTIVQDDEASNGRYAVRIGSRAVRDAPASAEAHIRFNVDVETPGIYNFHARIKAQTSKDNSFWVKVNDGPWLEWFRDIRIGDRFYWNEVLDSPFDLVVGDNTILFAYREDGTQFDKLYLSRAPETPEDFGPNADNCGDVPVALASDELSATAASAQVELEVADETADAAGGKVTEGTRQVTPLGYTQPTLTDETELLLFPNPTNGYLNVRLQSAYSGQVNVVIADMNGRVVRTLTYNKGRGEINERLEVYDLASGTYQIRIIQGDSYIIKPFVKLP